MRRMTLTVVASSIVVGVIVGLFHTEEAFLAQWIGECGASSMHECEPPPWTHGFAAVASAGLFAVLMSPVIVLAKSRVRPSVYCRHCPGAGWVPDLAPTRGRCPLCGSERFDHHGVRLSAAGMAAGLNAVPVPTVNADVAGPELLEK